MLTNYHTDASQRRSRVSARLARSDIKNIKTLVGPAALRAFRYLQQASQHSFSML